MDTDVIIVGAGPDGPYRVTARYLVGCDGPRGRVREQTGIPFSGTTHPEVNRPGQHALPDSVTLLELQDSIRRALRTSLWESRFGCRAASFRLGRRGDTATGGSVSLAPSSGGTAARTRLNRRGASGGLS
ncbi:FAD-dependent monooxygenase [Streptomyces mirabilis]|uniref:FAD-dependent monooxygenase n=1 Tax=Streptomyces mirabilis TaxID=68239 RepID=UPI00332576BA